MELLSIVNAWPLSHVALLIIAGLIGGLVRGYSGFGFGMASVPIFILGFAPSDIVPPVLFLEVVIGLFTVRAAHGNYPVGALNSLLLGTLIGTPLGIAGLQVAPVDALRIFIPSTMLICAIVLGLNAKVRWPLTPWVLRGTGLVSGLLNGAIAASGPPVIVLLMGSTLTSVQVRSLLIMFILASALLGIISVFLGGIATLKMAAIVLTTAPSVALGVALGSMIFRRANNQHYRLIGLILIGFIASAALISALVNG